jgi:hypothetical protein
VNERKVDSKVLLQIAVGRIGCSLAVRLLGYASTRVTIPLNMRIKQFYSMHTFHAMARLDVPTFSDDLVQRQLEKALPTNSRSSIAWETVLTASHILTTFLQLISQLSVLLNALRSQDDGVLLASLCLIHGLFQWGTIRRQAVERGGRVHLLHYYRHTP